MSTQIDTGTNDLLATLDEGVLTLTLNRPEARNAMTGDMTSALAAQLADAELNPEVKVIVLTGAGKGFCAGGDVKGMAAKGDGTVGDNTIDGAIHRQRVNQRNTAGKLYSMPKPTVAVLPGAAAGAGLSLALACDLRIMSSNAIMTTAFARVGFSGDYGGSWLLTQLIGPSRTKDLYYTARRVQADEALQLGLFNHVVADAELPSAAFELAKQIASGPPIALGYMKENINRAVTGDLRSCLALEADRMTRCAATKDHKEAVTAFLEKRQPVFSGR